MIIFFIHGDIRNIPFFEVHTNFYRLYLYLPFVVLCAYLLAPIYKKG